MHVHGQLTSADLWSPPHRPNASYLAVSNVVPSSEEDTKSTGVGLFHLNQECFLVHA